MSRSGHGVDLASLARTTVVSGRQNVNSVAGCNRVTPCRERYESRDAILNTSLNSRTSRRLSCPPGRVGQEELEQDRTEAPQ